LPDVRSIIVSDPGTTLWARRLLFVVPGLGLHLACIIAVVRALSAPPNPAWILFATTLLLFLPAWVEQWNRSVRSIAVHRDGVTFTRIDPRFEDTLVFSPLEVDHERGRVRFACDGFTDEWLDLPAWIQPPERAAIVERLTQIVSRGAPRYTDEDLHDLSRAHLLALVGVRAAGPLPGSPRAPLARRGPRLVRRPGGDAGRVDRRRGGAAREG